MHANVIDRNPVLISILAVAATACIFVAPLANVAVVILVPAIAVSLGWVTLHAEFMPEFLIGAAYFALLGLKIDIGGLNLRPNMLIAILGSIWIIRSRANIPYFPLFLSVNGVYLTSTIMHSGSPFFWRGIADCLLLTINLLQYAIVTRAQSLDRLLRIVFVSSSAAYSVLVVLYIVMAAGFLPALEKPEGEFVRMALLDPTPASYIIFTLLALVAYIYLFGFPFSTPFTLWCLTAHFAALVLSYARAAWLSFVFAFLCFWLFCAIRFPLRRAVFGTVVLLLTLTPIVIGSYLTFSTDVGDLLVERAQAVSLEEGTVVSRLLLWTSMFQDWQTAPIFGHGAHSYAKFQEYPAQISENYTLELLHSGGVVTAGLYLAALGLLLFGVVPSNWTDAVSRPWSLPLATGFLGMSISALANPAMEGGVYWIGAGLLVIAAKKAHEVSASQKIRQ